MNGTPARLAELLAALSLAGDLGNNFPPEKSLRTCLLAMRLGRAAGLGAVDLHDLYFMALLRFVGCGAYASETARIFRDDNALRSTMSRADTRQPRQMLRALGDLSRGQKPLRKIRTIAAMMTQGPKMGAQLARADCDALVQAARRLSLPQGVMRGLADIYERWDGKGDPKRSSRERIALTARALTVAHQAERHFSFAGLDAAREQIESGAGGWFDPHLAEVFADGAEQMLADFDDRSVWERALEAEPAPHTACEQARLDDLAIAFADLSDLKSVWLTGHSRAVGNLAGDACARLGLDAGAQIAARRAGWLHDIGRMSVPTGIWDKRGPLDVAEWERVRLHAYHGERVLARSPVLAPLAEIAGLHHERMDGSGYHRGANGAPSPSPARVLAAADVFCAMVEDRPHRPAVPAERAAAEVQSMAARGLLEPASVEAVCAAAGQRVERAEAPRPAGLSSREIDVLRHLARGLSNKEIAGRLSLSPGTVHTHVLHIYEKAGCSSRAGATLFALEHGLLPGGSTIR